MTQVYQLILVRLVELFSHTEIRMKIFARYGTPFFNPDTGEICFGKGEYTFTPTSGQYETIILGVAAELNIPIETLRSLEHSITLLLTGENA